MPILFLGLPDRSSQSKILVSSRYKVFNFSTVENDFNLKALWAISFLESLCLKSKACLSTSVGVVSITLFYSSTLSILSFVSLLLKRKGYGLLNLGDPISAAIDSNGAFAL